ncbi:Protein phosphatase 1 regulatory subunit 16A [Lucilia cuprina]|nr:Protein phosphatase 1 regulatory subunit 16A [Lucilia cuprina]
MVKGILVNRKSDESFKAQLKMEHADLVAEMQTVENLPTHERLQLARLRRAQQLKVARQKEKEWLKLQRAKGVNLSTLNGMNTTHHFRNSSNLSSSSKRHISFENSVVLLEAASRNDMHEVAELLEHGITPDAANEDGLTALHQCCIDNNVEMLKLLLEYGANVDAQDSDKWTPLHAAATCGHLELVRILIDHGANLLAVNTDGNMPYDLCDDENTLDYIEAEMSKRGVTQELIDETRSATERLMLRDLMELSKNGGDIEQPDEHGATPLHIASANGYIKVVEFLLEQHVNVDALDRDMWSPVHAAACWGHLEVLEMLAQCGADLNIKNKDDETPSDICEDPEIRERIEQLKTEQESKRLAEAQRRRVRRSQSNNTRAQSVRRTSLRDKTLTTKKDAVEEARLRLQAQEVFVTATPDSTTLDPNGITDHNHHTQLDGSAADWLAKTSNAATNHHNNNNNNNNTLKTNNNHRNSYDPSLKDMVDSNSISSMSLQQLQQHQQHSYQPRRPPEGRENDELQMHAFKTNGEHSTGGATGQHINGLNGVGIGGGNDGSSASTATTAAAVIAATTTANTGHGTEAVQIQSSKEATNGKINVQVTVLVDTSNTHNLQQQQQSQQTTHLHHNQQQHQTSQQQTPQQQHMHMHLHGHGHYNNLTGSTTATFHNQLPHHNPSQQQLQQHHPLLQLQHQNSQLLDMTLSSSQGLANATTLANLKKQRSMSRCLNGNNANGNSSNCENGSVLGAANSTNHNHNHISHNNHHHNHNNNNTLEGQVNTQQPALSNGGLQHPALMDYNGLINDHPSSAQQTAAGVGVGGGGGAGGGSATAGGMNKFSGVTGDVPILAKSWQIYAEFALYQAVPLVLMVFSNLLNWRYFLKALQLTEQTLTATVLTAASNYIVSFILGSLVFKEHFSFYSILGSTFIVLGLWFLCADTQGHKIILLQNCF